MNFHGALAAVNVNILLALKFGLNACLAPRARQSTCTALRGNNRSDFPKGSDTGTKINCTVLKMNKGNCAVIKEARALHPCRPEPTFNKPPALPVCLPDGLRFHIAAEADREQSAIHTHLYTSTAQKAASVTTRTTLCMQANAHTQIILNANLSFVKQREQ